jgi:hypothetical protein
VIHLVYVSNMTDRTHAVLRRAYSTRDLAEHYAERKNKEDKKRVYFVTSLPIHG